MKSHYLVALVAFGVFAPTAFSLSLYDTAPPIGLPESHAVRYSASVSGGYDDNVNSSKYNKEESFYASFSLGASYADYESVNKISYSATLGGTLYNKRANGANQRLFSNIGLSASMSRSFSAGSSYSLSLSLSYTPEPDYANGISAARTQGDCLNWSISNAYSQSIDSRWSWTVSASTSGNIYTTGTYRDDNREYISTSASLNYKASTQTSYSVSTSYRFDFRETGNNSNNLYLNLSVNHALDPVSSCSLSVGTQTKFIAGDTNLYPNIRAGYNRTLSQGLSVNSYLSLDNENVNTYQRTSRGGINFLSDMTWRVGATFSYAINPLMSATFGGSLLSSAYSKGTNGAADVDRTTWTLNCGLSYRVTSNLSWNINYNYTHATGSYEYGYDRNNVSTGLSYSF